MHFFFDCGFARTLFNLSLAIAIAAGPSRAQEKASVPGEQALQDAKKAAGEIYGARFRKAKTSDERSALALEMIDAATKLQDGGAGQFALLSIAADVAVGAGDASTTLDAVEQLVKRFDAPAADLIAGKLLAAAGQASTSKEHAAVAEAALSVVHRLAEADDYDASLRLFETARASAMRAREFALAKDLATHIQRFKMLDEVVKQYRNALAVLDEKPADPAANLQAGRYLCFVQGDWDRGVPMLALGEDEALKAIAVRELRGAKSAEEQAAIGDAWWELAQKRDGEERDEMRVRAGYWYRMAEPTLRGALAGLKIKQRLDELAKLGLSDRLDEAAGAVQTASAPPERSLATLAESEPAPPADGPPIVFRAQKFAWRDGDPPTRMIRADRGFCFPSMLNGNFQGLGDGIEVKTSDGWWYLNGQAQNWLKAEAIAIEPTGASFTPARTAVWKTGNGIIRLINGREGFCYLSGIAGGLRGGEEAIHVGLERDGWWYVAGRASVPLSVTVGIVPWPTDHGPAEVAAHTWRRNDPPIKMIHKDEGFCVLTGIGGGFNGGGEKVVVELGGDDFWYLRGSAAQPPVFGEAISLRFVKRPE